MNWSYSDLGNDELTVRIIQGDYNALKESVAESNALIREAKPIGVAEVDWASQPQLTTGSIPQSEDKSA